MSDHRLNLLAIAFALAAFGWPHVVHAIDVAPRYGAGSADDRPATERAGLRDEDVRPDLYFFHRAIGAAKRKQYQAAVAMFETSASWGYKPAQYNLAMMYVTGQGIAIDKPRALAWAALAAERGNDDYIDARELIYSELTADEFAAANAIWRGLRKTYADAVALERAKHRLTAIEAKTATPRIGSIGEGGIAASRSGNVPPIGESPGTSAVVTAPEAPWPTGTAAEPIEVSPYGGGDAD